VVTVPMYPCEDTFAIRLMNNITAIRILFDAMLPTHYRLLADAINNSSGLLANKSGTAFSKKFYVSQIARPAASCS